LQQQLDHRRKKLESQIEVLKTDLRSDEIELEHLIEAEAAYLTQIKIDEGEMRVSRKGSGQSDEI
jgi:circadian clock protein KaiC